MENKNLAPQELIKRFAEIQNISLDEANKIIGGETEQEILDNIKSFTAKQIESKMVLNRAQKRKMKKNKKLQKFVKKHQLF